MGNAASKPLYRIFMCGLINITIGQIISYRTKLRPTLSRGLLGLPPFGIIPKTSTTPSIVPSADRIGAPLSWIGSSRPSRMSKTVWFARPTSFPVDDLEDRRNGLSNRLIKRPTCQTLSLRIKEGDAP